MGVLIKFNSFYSQKLTVRWDFNINVNFFKLYITFSKDDDIATPDISVFPIYVTKLGKLKFLKCFESFRLSI